MSDATQAPERRIRMPHTLVIVGSLIVFVLVLSWLVPSGTYQTMEKAGRQVTIPGTYQRVAKVVLGPQWLVIAPIRGFLDGSLIIAFLILIGGAFNVIQTTGIVELGIRRITAALASRPRLEKLMVPVLMTIFSLAGSVFGMSEEVIPFILICVPLALSLGYDSIVGVSIPFLGAAAGFGAAFFNPFTVGLAQGLVGLPLYSGLGYRVITWFVCTGVIVGWVMVYAARVKRRPESSPVYALDQARDRSAFDASAPPEPWTFRRILVVVLFLAGMVALVWGILQAQWFIEEIGALFLAMGLLMGAVAGLKPDEIATSFVAGAKDMVNVTLIIACGRALLIIAREARVLDTILYASSGVISMLPTVVAAQVMFVVQAVINFFIHSGTAQAALTMPIMAPLADLVGLTRQTTVYAYQLCELINPILPTSAVTMGVLGMAKIPWETWARWFLPLMLTLCALSFLLLVPPVLMHWGPF
ncbi:MAG: putative basic amino acid antiporter YfcC [Acidobacteria bacterium]|nr:putative basic amino acid antiporter YfcC [Acidobacteriota bacterium]